MKTVLLLKNRYGRAKYVIWTDEPEDLMQKKLLKLRNEYYDELRAEPIINYIKEQLDKAEISYKIQNLEDLTVVWI